MLNHDRTLAILLGVSACPRAPKLQSLPQCANSVEDFENYLRSRLGIEPKNIINLFDAEASASDQLDRIEDWLAQHLTLSDIFPTDLLVYYTGHAGFTRNDQSYFLAIRKTKEGSEGATSIRYVDLASSIKRHANDLRKYLILDCCFAAAAAVKTMANFGQVMVRRIEEELPPSGTALLCSSSAKLVSIAPPNERHTMFSGALLHCLNEGVPKGPQTLTLQDVGKATLNVIRHRYPNYAVRPEIHVPDQPHGDLAQVPLFPNFLWQELPAVEKAIPETIPPRSSEGRLLRRLLLHFTKIAVGILSSVRGARTLAQILADIWRSTIARAAVLVAHQIRVLAQNLGSVGRSAIGRAAVLVAHQRGTMFILGVVFAGVVFFMTNRSNIAVSTPTPATSLPDRSEINPCLGEGSQDAVTVGAIYPLSTSTGKRAKAAIEFAREIINDDFRGLLLGNDRRFCITVLFRDSNSEASVGVEEARDLITNKKVVALNGAYESGVTEIVSEATEKLGIPFLNGESVADNLTENDLKWFFRTTPAATEIARMYADFLKNIKEYTVGKIAIVYENNRYGRSVAPAVKKTFKEYGLNITLDISYPGPLPDEAASEFVGKLSSENPDVVMFMSYLDEARKFATQMKKVKYRPRMMIADEAGYSEPDFVCEFGNMVEGVLTRSSWIVGKPGTVSYRVNDMYKNKFGGIDLDSITARTMQGFMVLAGAINRAQSTKSEAIRDALRDTNLEPNQLIAHYAGVKFNDRGQNTMGSVLLTQLQDTENGLKFVPVWPEKEATEAGTKLLRYTGFRDGTGTPPTNPKCPPK